MVELLVGLAVAEALLDEQLAVIDRDDDRVAVLIVVRVEHQPVGCLRAELEGERAVVAQVQAWIDNEHGILIVINFI